MRVAFLMLRTCEKCISNFFYCYDEVPNKGNLKEKQFVVDHSSKWVPSMEDLEKALKSAGHTV